MVVRKRKKNTRQRAGRFHGWGAEHRGSGKRGGKGNAGSGKRAQSKKPSNRERVFGKHGFTSLHQKENAINLDELHRHLPAMLEQGSATKQGTIITVDLAKTPYTKVLSRGEASKMVIKGKASAKAKEKLERAGGSVQ